MKCKKIIALTLTAAISMCMLAGCGDKKDSAEGGNKKDLKLTIYCGLMEDHMVKAVEEFKK